jgi:Ca2+-binding RTX toxin-like protein
MAINLGFELGNLTEWSAVGDVEVVSTVFDIAPTQGNFQALLTTDNSFSVSDTDLEAFLGLASGALDALATANVTEGSAIQSEFLFVKAGEVLTFDWNFLTDEFTPIFFNDLAFVSVNATPSLLEDTTGIFFSTLNPFSFLSNSQTGYQAFEYKAPSTGYYSIGAGVVDVGDSVVDSYLLVDNLRILKEIVGNSSNNNLNGTSAGESIKGLAGDDQINGNGGGDNIFGGSGNDTITGSSSRDYINGESGNDVIYGNGGRDYLLGGSGNDLIFGGSQQDLILGGDGNDTIYGNGGGDLISGGAGSDRILLGGGTAQVTLETGSGFDTIINFQLGKTKFVFDNLGGLSFADSSSGARILDGSDLLAVVSAQTASTLENNFSDIFIQA